MHRRDFLRSVSIAAAVNLPSLKLSAQKVESSQIPDLVAADRILAAHEIVDAYGHVSVRSDQNPQHFFMSRSLAPELVTADDILEYDLDCKVIGNSKAAVFLAWGNPNRTRFGVRSGYSFEVAIYTTVRSEFLSDYYSPGFYQFGNFRGGIWRHHHRFNSFGLYSYPFDPYPDIVSYEVPYKIAYFEGDRCTGWEYLSD